MPSLLCVFKSVPSLTHLPPGQAMRSNAKQCNPMSFCCTGYSSVLCIICGPKSFWRQIWTFCERLAGYMFFLYVSMHLFSRWFFRCSAYLMSRVVFRNSYISVVLCQVYIVSEWIYIYICMAASSASGPSRFCFDMYMYMYRYMHMFGLREPMVLSALKCLCIAGPVIADSKICSYGHAANPKGTLCLFLVLSYYGWAGLLGWRWVVPQVLTVRTRRIGSDGSLQIRKQCSLIELRGFPLGAFPCRALREPRRG